MAEIVWIVALVVAVVVAWLLGRGWLRKRYAGILEDAARAAREGDAEGVRRAGAGSGLPGVRQVKEVLLRDAGSGAAGPEERRARSGAPAGEEEAETFVHEGLGRISSYLREGVEEPLRSGIGGEESVLRGSVEDALVAVEDIYFYLRDVPEARSREDLNELARSAVDEFREEWDADVDVHVPERPTVVEVNREAFLDALYLVLHNASSFGGGEIEVVVRYQDGDCWLVVRDRGEGFGEEALERAFEPFFSTARLGLGLGLYHVRKIVQAMGGSVAVRNRPRGGGQVEIVLPEAE